MCYIHEYRVHCEDTLKTATNSIQASASEYIGYIQQSIISALSIIDLILNNISNQTIDTSQFTQLSITDAIEQALSLYPFNNNDKQRVIVDVQQDFQFKGSQTLFNYVLFNLIKNAVYYFESAKDARITINATTTDKHNLLIFKDTGIGIAQDKLASLFDDFISSDKPNGTGLGLSFCKRAMQAFGSDISCNSELGKYTEFKLTFPKTQ